MIRFWSNRKYAFELVIIVSAGQTVELGHGIHCFLIDLLQGRLVLILDCGTMLYVRNSLLGALAEVRLGINPRRSLRREQELLLWSNVFGRIIKDLLLILRLRGIRVRVRRRACLILCTRRRQCIIILLPFLSTVFDFLACFFDHSFQSIANFGVF